MESTATDNIRDDAVSQVLGKDKPGRVRGLGRGYTLTKLSYLQARDSYVQKLEATRTELLNEMKDLRNVVHDLAGRKREDNNVSTSEIRRVSKEGVKCQLLDWCSSDDAIVGEGEFCSADHMYKIGRLPIGPNAVAVIVKSVANPEAPVWRQTLTIEKLGDCVGMKITWPAEKVILDNDIEPPETETESSLAARASAGRVYIFNYWNLDEEIIGEGILCSTDPSYLFNNLPLGPNGAIVKVDHVNKGDAFLWRPTSEIPNLGVALNENIAWPIERIHLVKPVTPPEDTSRKSTASANNSTSSSKGKKQKCILLDCNGSGTRVAQGRVCSSEPTDTVHFVPLGPNASKVMIEVPKVANARVWRPNSEVEFISDAVGSQVAWPNDKIIFV